jgi:hypothetical protein
VGNLLNDDTIRHYFIQGFSMPSTIQNILNMRPKNLDATIVIALEVKVIDKENDRMLQRENEPIPAFILLYHYPNEFPRYPIMDYHHATIPQIPLMQPTPLAMLPLLEPIRMAAPSVDHQWEEFKIEVKQLLSSVIWLFPMGALKARCMSIRFMVHQSNILVLVFDQTRHLFTTSSHGSQHLILEIII